MRINNSISFLIIISLLIAGVVACEKEPFNHGAPEIQTTCACCMISDTITGDYAGRLQRYTYNFSVSADEPELLEFTDDSVFFSVNRVYTDSDFMSDSLICQFEVPDFFSETIYLNNNSGYFAPAKYSHQFFDTTGTLFLANSTEFGYHTYFTLVLNAERR